MVMSSCNNDVYGLVKEIKRNGVTDERVLAAITRIPRECFVNESLVDSAYHDRPLPIGREQTISQPTTVAIQTELLQLRPSDKVLEIGTGSGYQTAILCEMGADVYSIERIHELHFEAERTLKQLGYKPKLFFADGYASLPDHAPFDKILITAAAPINPEGLLLQLRIGGLLVAPIGETEGQQMAVIERVEEDKFQKTVHGYFRFVPMKQGTEE